MVQVQCLSFSVYRFSQEQIDFSECWMGSVPSYCQESCFVSVIGFDGRLPPVGPTWTEGEDLVCAGHFHSDKWSESG